MKIQPVSVAVLVWVILYVVGGCRSNPPIPSQSLFHGDLTGDALKTHAAHARAINAGTEQTDTDIQPTYWAERIKALHPIKVYNHRVNIVVVQRIVGDFEEGKYICIPISSYLPMSGEDGFEFTPNPKTGNAYTLGNGVFDFRRTRDR